MKFTYSLFVALCLAIISLTFPTLALASDDHECAHEPTVESLHHCVLHAAEAGHIDNPGVTTSLLSKLDAAQGALDLGQTDVAVNILQGFIHAVEAQAGKHIDEEHAAHMIEHANMVITALSQ